MKQLKQLFPENCYRIESGDVEKASLTAAAAFRDDPVWSYIFPDDPDGSRMALSFEVPLRYILRYGIPCASTDKLEAVALWLPHNTADMTFWRLVRSGAMTPAAKLGKETGAVIQKTFKEITVADDRLPLWEMLRDPA